MSRLAKKPTIIPVGVTVIVDDHRVTVKGKNGELFKDYKKNYVSIVVEGSEITFTLKKNDVFGRSIIGTYVAHVRNMIKGVTEGFTKKLILEGVGYKVNLEGNTLVMALGFSHPVAMAVPTNLTVTVEKNTTTISGFDKELVGSFAADLRAQKKPEPYKGKGMRYDDEIIRRKQGKKAA